MINLVGGGFRDVGGTPIAGGAITFTLSQDAQLIAGGQVAPLSVSYALDANGDIQSGATIYSNPELIPSTTYYIISVYDAGGARVWGPERCTLPNNGTFNLNNLVPLTLVPSGTTLATVALTGKYADLIGSAPVTSVAGKTGAVTLGEGDIANLTTDLAAKAPAASPTFTGTVTIPGVKLIHPQSYVFEDFITDVVRATVSNINNTSNTAPVGVNSYIGSLGNDDNHPGQGVIVTGTTAGAGRAWTIAAQSFPFGVGYPTRSVIEACVNVGTSLSNIRVRFGYFTNTITNIEGASGGTSTPGAEVMFNFDSGVSPNWRTRTSTDGQAIHTRDNTSSVAVTASTWYVLRIESDSSNSYFYINNVLVATHSAASDYSPVNQNMRCCFSTITLDTTSKTSAIDYFSYFKPVTR